MAGLLAHAFGTRPPFGVLSFTLGQIPRVILPLSFVEQPRMNPEILPIALGVLIGSLLCVVFRSMGDALLIMVNLPLALIGGVVVALSIRWRRPKTLQIS